MDRLSQAPGSRVIWTCHASGVRSPLALTREAEPPCHASLHQLLHQGCNPALHGPCLHM